MNTEKRKFIHSLVFPVFFLFMMWLVKIIEIIFNVDLVFLGIHPLKAEGLAGILTSPLIHGSFSHLISNSFPLLILGACLFYFYRKIAYKVFFLIYFLTGLWVWFGARDAWHIGASGIVYGLASFLFISGIIRKNPRLMAITFFVAFFYGSMIWGIFPDFFPFKNISWEGHLMGLISGLVLAVFYRKEGPQRKLYSWDFEDEEDDENDDEENAYWKTNCKMNCPD